MIQTIFYFLGSVCFFLWIGILAAILIFTVKILRKAISIEVEIKNTVGEAKSAITDVRNKVATFSVSIAGIVALLEKLIDLKAKAQNRGGGNEKEEHPKKEKKQKKFAEDDF
jgi:MFS superfamily sulfate permease-like transporter